MILHEDDGTQRFAQVTAFMPCVRATAVTFTAADFQRMLELRPEDLYEWLATGPALRFGPYTYTEDLKAQQRSIHNHNEGLS